MSLNLPKPAMLIPVWLIEDSTSGVATWYSAKLARDHGVSIAWTVDREEATWFTSRELALSFAEMRMPTLSTRVIEWNRSAG